MLSIGAEPAALTSPQVVTAHLSSDWVFTAPTVTSRDAFWTVPGEGNSALVTSQLMVRAQRPGQDVILRTTQGSCVRQVRSELKSRKLPMQAVTCPNCEAFRYQGEGFETTIYSQMKGDYPFVVVVHQVPAADNATKNSGAKVVLPMLPAKRTDTTSRALADQKGAILDGRAFPVSTPKK
ncbi:hypothetical protein IC235_10435 [Hymenobacter sp. BT664]|uniref:Uncharacterized protein n=1 Tax=Hymenobacter montanus TaxID=2771359 RepID=A0A927GJE0_9BACT|nr:hypothetical protein [Hymenobacter montanus]MBD2768310.1 hypothetical protein [Hymenobacter montanus]